jgi:hypothetical protein
MMCSINYSEIISHFVIVFTNLATCLLHCNLTILINFLQWNLYELNFVLYSHLYLSNLSCYYFTELESKVSCLVQILVFVIMIRQLVWIYQRAHLMTLIMKCPWNCWIIILSKLVVIRLFSFKLMTSNYYFTSLLLN